MSFLRIASVFQLLFASLGFRIRREKKPKTAPMTSTPHEFPASPTCLLASGFGLQRGCQYPEAMEPVPDCDNAAFDQVCYTTSPAESVRGYMRDVRSTSDYSSLTRSVTEAEGGGFGVSVSASFSYMKRSQVTEKSIAFFIGASGRTQTRSIQSPVKLKLTSAAKALIQENPREFIARHGLRYIHSITYGGSFLGSVTLNSRETVSERDIGAMAGFSVNKGVFSAKASTEFQETMSQQHLNISVFTNAQWVGGSGIVQDYQSPETLGEMFQEWDRAWRADPAPLTVITRRWIDSADVQSVVNSMSAEDKELFNTRDITQSIAQEISQENALVALTATSVTKALTWREIQNDRATQSCLTALSRDVNAKLMRIDLLNDANVLTIQDQWLAGNYSWFEADTLNDRYLSCVDGIQPPTPAPTPAPTKRTCKSKKLNPCTAHPIDWYQPRCSQKHGSGYEKNGWQHCAGVGGGRYRCQKTWTCTQRHDAGNCCGDVSDEW